LCFSFGEPRLIIFVSSGCSQKDAELFLWLSPFWHQRRIISSGFSAFQDESVFACTSLLAFTMRFHFKACGLPSMRTRVGGEEEIFRVERVRTVTTMMKKRIFHNI
jgi:hypothetical protein